jgi:hypothetical protein
LGDVSAFVLRVVLARPAISGDVFKLRIQAQTGNVTIQIAKLKQFFNEQKANTNLNYPTTRIS